MAPEPGRRLFPKGRTTTPPGNVGQPELATPLGGGARTGLSTAARRRKRASEHLAPGLLRLGPSRFKRKLVRRLHHAFSCSPCAAPRSRAPFLHLPQAWFLQKNPHRLSQLTVRKHGSQGWTLTADPSSDWSPNRGHSLEHTRPACHSLLPPRRGCQHCPSATSQGPDAVLGPKTPGWEELISAF